MSTKQLKAIISISLLIFVIFSLVIIFLGFFVKPNRTLTDNVPNPVTSSNSSNVYTNKEISQHNNSSSCWLIINNKVYNVTNYLNDHPGGSFVMTPFCGSDATVAFNTKDKVIPRSHSQYAVELLNQFYIGDYSGN